MLRNSPIVSVCLPTYNRAKMLREALASVLSQTLRDLEIIVSDNASVDDTELVVRSFGDPRIVYVKNARNVGAVPNINRCYAMARGEFIALCPDDDLMLPDNLARKVEVLRSHMRVGLVHSRFHVIDENGNVIRANTNKGHGPERDADAVEPGGVFLRRMLEGVCEVNPVSAVFRRECWEKLGGLDESLKYVDDYEYWMRIAVYYDVAYLAAPLVMWRAHAQTLTSQFVVGGKTGVSPSHLREQLRCKKNILDRYGKDIPDVRDLRKMLRRQTAERVAFQADCMLDEGTARSDVRRFLRGMGSGFPHLYATRLYWKMLAKTVVPWYRIRMLKKLRRSISH
jgi:glycosyltransferase involved in cell wall biosynthesis